MSSRVHIIYICIMNLVLQPFRVLWKVWVFIHFVISLVLLYPLLNYLLSDRRRYHKAFSVMRFWAHQIMFLSGIFIRVERKGKLPDGPFIICPNHSSYFDIITMYLVFKRYFIFMGKAEILDWPLFNIFFSKGMNISVNRANNRDAMAAMKRTESELALGHNIVIFPEGTIPPTAPKMRAFKNGAFKLALDQNVPIVPVTFLNNWKRLQAGPVLKRRGGPGISKVIVHEPVYPSNYKSDDVVQLKKDIFAIIEKPLNDG